MGKALIVVTSHAQLGSTEKKTGEPLTPAGVEMCFHLCIGKVFGGKSYALRTLSSPKQVWT